MAKGRDERDGDGAEAEGKAGAEPPAEPQRVDKWLWYARVVKSRTLAAALVEAGKVRLNRQRFDKPSQVVKAGDVLTIALEREVRVLKVVRAGTRRGPAPEARMLFEDLTPPPPTRSEAAVAAISGPPRRAPGAGRPTKRERRHIDRLRGGSGEE
jgi:ribosome-associated heat shock protein Hsp15